MSRARSFLLAPLRADVWGLRYWDGQRLLEHGEPIETRGLAELAFDEARGDLAVLDDGGQRLRHVEVYARGTLAPREIALPEGHTGRALALDAGVLYLGGGVREGSEDEERTAHRLLSIGLGPNEAEAGWRVAPSGPGVEQPGKSLDHLFIDGERLIVVDDLMLPLYILIYDLRERREPVLVEVVDMPVHYTYEQVRAAALGDRWLASASGGINHGLLCDFLSVLDRERLEERFAWFYHPDRPTWVRDDEPERSGGLGPTRALAFDGDVLYIAGDAEGLGVLDLRGVPIPVAAPPPKPPRRGPLDSTASAGPTIRYVPVEGLGAVHYVATLAARPGCLAVERRAGEDFAWRWVEPLT